MTGSEEPSGSCPVCRRRDPRWPPVCDLCRHRLAARLWELRDLHALLVSALLPGQNAQQRVSGSREEPVPLRLAPLDWAAPAILNPDGSHRDGTVDLWRDQQGYPSVAAVLDSWALDWSDYLGSSPPDPEVPALVSWLSRHLAWAIDHHPAIVEFAEETTVMLYALRALLNVSRKPIYLQGEACPRCNHQALRRDPGGGDVECGNCRETWPFEKFNRLAVVLASDHEEDAA